MITMRFFTRPLAVFLTVFAVFCSSFAQQHTPCVFVANGGTFEFAPPYSDYVTVGVINQFGVYTPINTVYTQSVQQAIALSNPINSHAVLLAAQDSLVLFESFDNSLVRLHTAAIPDIFGSFHALCQVNSDIFAGEWYGSDANYLHVYNSNLQLQTSVAGIDQDVRGMVAIGDTLYVAQNLQNANFSDSLGYISKVHIPSRTYAGRFGFGNAAFTGVSDLFNYNGMLVAIGRGQGNVIKYTPASGAIQTTSVVGSVGKAFYLKGDEICLIHLGNPHNYNLQTGVFTDLSCYIPNTTNSVISATPEVIDATSTLPSVLFTSDFSTIGDAFMKAGNCVSNHISVGISPEATTTFSSLITVSVSKEDNLLFAKIAPNPISSQFTIATNSDLVFNLKITDVLGAVLIEKNNVYNGEPVDVSHLNAGTYFLILQNNQGKTTRKIEILR